jgi:hypothetical protein
MLTRTGYLVNSGPIQEIKKELTVRPVVNGDYGFPPPPFKVFRPAKNGVCVPRFYGTSKLGEPKKIRDQSQPVSIPNLSDSLGILHTKMMHYEQQLKLAMASFLYHVGTAKRRYPWP